MVCHIYGPCCTKSEYWLFGGREGGLEGALNPVLPKVQGCQRSRVAKVLGQEHLIPKKIYAEGKRITTSFHIYICEETFCGYLGGPGGPSNNWTGPILISNYLLTQINLYIKYESNPIRTL